MASSDRVSAHGEARNIIHGKKTVASACVLVAGHFTNKTLRNQVPLPHMDEVWDRLSGHRYFSSIALISGYHKIRLRESCAEKTALRTRCGQFEYLVTPFGLIGAPECFQTLMNNIFTLYLDNYVLFYFDDIQIYAKTKEQHIERLEVVLQTLREHKLYAKKSKMSIS